MLSFENRLKRMTSALHHETFRRFLIGALLSNVGSWMQSVAQAWLVLQLTDSPFYLGLDTFAATLPMAIFSFWGGVIADRVNRRKALLISQIVVMALALILGLLTAFHMVQVWHVILLSFGTGFVQAISWPLYQALIAGLVPKNDLSNAIALNSIQFNLARTIGPVLGALALRYFGMSGCFFVNALSFVALILVLLQPWEAENRPLTKLPRVSTWHAMQEALEYVQQRPMVKWLLMLLAVSSVLGVPMVTLLPVYARDILHSGSGGFGLLVGAFGFGAVVGGLWVASQEHPSAQFVMRAFFMFTVGMALFAYSRWMILSMVLLFGCGLAIVCYASTINSLVQFSVSDALRGRVMSLFVFAFGGCMPLGNLLSGYFAEHWGAPQTLLTQALLFFFIVTFVHFRYSEQWKKPA